MTRLVINPDFFVTKPDHFLSTSARIPLLLQRSKEVPELHTLSELVHLLIKQMNNRGRLLSPPDPY